MLSKLSIVAFLCLAEVIVGSPVSSDSSVAAAENGVLLPTDSEKKLEQLGGFFQGDMRFGEDQQDNSKNAMINTWYRWPNKTVYYEIDPAFDTAKRNIILGAINAIQLSTCVKFYPRTASTANYIYVQGESSGCWSYVGCTRGRQELNLQLNGCVYHGTAIHEFLHALALRHQHGDTNRDSYVQILWQNIIDGYAYAFDKYDSSTVTDFGLGYDYDSVMHYDAYAFSINGQKTIQTLNPWNAAIGQRAGLSAKDILKIKYMYNC